MQSSRESPPFYKLSNSNRQAQGAVAEQGLAPSPAAHCCPPLLHRHRQHRGHGPQRRVEGAERRDSCRRLAASCCRLAAPHGQHVQAVRAQISQPRAGQLQAGESKESRFNRQSLKDSTVLTGRDRGSAACVLIQRACTAANCADRPASGTLPRASSHARHAVKWSDTISCEAYARFSSSASQSWRTAS